MSRRRPLSNLSEGDRIARIVRRELQRRNYPSQFPLAAVGLGTEPTDREKYLLERIEAVWLRSRRSARLEALRFKAYTKDKRTFFLKSGGKPMSGDLDLGGNSVTNVDRVDGYDISKLSLSNMPDIARANIDFDGQDVVDAATITWGGDTNLYRSAANYLKTDDFFIVGGLAAKADQLVYLNGADGLLGASAIDKDDVVLHTDWSSNGFITRTGAGTYAERTITAGDWAEVTQGAGASGNPTIGVKYYIVPLNFCKQNANSNQWLRLFHMGVNSYSDDTNDRGYIMPFDYHILAISGVIDVGTYDFSNPTFYIRVDKNTGASWTTIWNFDTGVSSAGNGQRFNSGQQSLSTYTGSAGDCLGAQRYWTGGTNATDDINVTVWVAFEISEV